LGVRFCTLRNIPGERRSDTVYVWKRLGEKVGAAILSVVVQGRRMNLTIYLHPVPSLRMSGALYTCAPLACLHGMEKNIFIFFLWVLPFLDDTNFGS
jgi:hypothetical protein